MTEYMIEAFACCGHSNYWRSISCTKRALIVNWTFRSNWNNYGCRRAVQEYTCPNCSRVYNTLHAAALIKSDGLFHCEDCDSILESGSADVQGESMNRRERTKMVKAKQVCTQA